MHILIPLALASNLQAWRRKHLDCNLLLVVLDPIVGPGSESDSEQQLSTGSALEELRKLSVPPIKSLQLVG